jgi:hypothetical protein
MNKITDVIGSRINSIIYRGESIFTIILEDKDGELIDLNLLGVEYLEMADVLSGEITIISEQRIGFKHIGILDKRNLDRNEFKCIFLEIKKDNNLFSLHGLIKKIEIDGHSQKYNPISDDKYL